MLYRDTDNGYLTKDDIGEGILMFRVSECAGCVDDEIVNFDPCALDEEVNEIENGVGYLRTNY